LKPETLFPVNEAVSPIFASYVNACDTFFQY
jgi:hypothetical protein